MQYTHLSVRSGYSFFNSMLQMEAYISFAEQHGFQTLTLTDEETLHGVIPFYQACKRANIKPIIGMIIDLPYEEEPVTCTLLAKNNAGYNELMNISTNKQRTDKIAIEQSPNLICIIHTESPLMRESIASDGTFIEKVLHDVNDRFGAENVYMQISRYKGEDERHVTACQQFAEHISNQFVVMQDVRYINENDEAAFHCLQQMKHGESWRPNDAASRFGKRYLYLKEEMDELFASFPHSLVTIEEITAACDVTFDFERLLLPAFPVPEEMTSADYLTAVCRKRIWDRYPEITDVVRERVREELRIITSLGFADYFLIVADYVQFAKDNGIAVGPGRGSAAGSIVSYILGITNVDPIKYNLLFERFLNPERVTMPDIDIDFSDIRREEVIAYVRKKYGEDYVAQIITFDTFGARSIIRELMKTMEVHPQDQTYVLKEFSHYTSGKIADFLQEREEFREYVKQSQMLRTLFTFAIKLEGLPRHHSIHAAGIVLGKDPLPSHVPLMTSSHGMNITQYPMNDLEAIGLLKMDILGLRNLSIIEEILASIKRKTGETIQLDQLPEQDEKTFALLREGKTNGVFQFESDGMKRVLTKLRPNNFDDLVAINALYRPGPMQHIDTFIERKHGKAFTFIHPAVAPILQDTYGVLVYQEQIMQIASTVAGFTLGQADVLRRAVSKKQRAVMMEQERFFVEGAKQNGYTESIAKEIFSWIVQFADYGFPKSHAVAYSKIAYQLSYLKANYPEHFFPPLLTSMMQDAKKVASYVKEAKQLGLAVLPPSINASFGKFTAEKGNIRIGLQLIKGVGYDTVKQIIEARKDGRFTDLYDFCLRTNVRRNVLENMIMAGVFDELHTNRASLLASIDQVMAQIQLFGQDSLFNERLTMTRNYVAIEDFTIVEKLRDEKELLHLYVSSHPLEQYRSLLTRKGFTPIINILTMAERQQVSVAGMIQEVRKITTKRGESMAFVSLQDEGEVLDVVVFPKLFREVHQHLVADSLVELSGKVSERNGEKQVIADTLAALPIESLEPAEKTLYIRVTKDKAAQAGAFIRKQAKQYPGTVPIVIHYPETKETYRMQDQFSLHMDETLFKQLMHFFGVDHVVIK